MKIEPQHVFALALMGSQGAWAAEGANASLDFFNSSLAPLSDLSFQAPAIQPIAPQPKLLLADASNSNIAPEGYSVQSDAFPSAYRNVGLVQVAQNGSTATNKTIVLDSCHRMEVGGEGMLSNGLSPLTALNIYLRETMQAPPRYLVDASVTVVRPPKFGNVVASISKYGETKFAYIATDKTWMGKDRVEFEVTYQGKTYKIIDRIEMVRDSEASDDLNQKYYDGPCTTGPRRLAYETSVQTADDRSEFDWDGVNAMLDSASLKFLLGQPSFSAEISFESTA